MLMLAILGTMMTDAAHRQRFQDAIHEFVSKLNFAEDDQSQEDYVDERAGAGLRKPRPGSGSRKPRSEHAVACCEVDRASCTPGVGIQPNPDITADDITTDDDSEAPELVYESDSDDEAPRMPCAAAPPAAHRDQAPSASLYNACVARPVKPAELKQNAKARAAMKLEWDRLRNVERPDGTQGV